jgi:26S proteasome regulatory subunit N9
MVVAAHLRLPVEQVEWVAMRAMSLSLLKGSMDEVDQTLQVCPILRTTWSVRRGSFHVASFG